MEFSSPPSLRGVHNAENCYSATVDRSNKYIIYRTEDDTMQVAISVEIGKYDTVLDGLRRLFNHELDHNFKTSRKKISLEETQAVELLSNIKPWMSNDK